MKPVRGIRVRAWRVMSVDGGVLVFCDPTRERIVILEEPWEPEPRPGHRVAADELPNGGSDQEELPW